MVSTLPADGKSASALLNSQPDFPKIRVLRVSGYFLRPSGYPPRASDYLPRPSGYVPRASGYPLRPSDYVLPRSDYPPRASGHFPRPSGYPPRASGYLLPSSGYPPRVSDCLQQGLPRGMLALLNKLKALACSLKARDHSRPTPAGPPPGSGQAARQSNRSPCGRQP